MKFIDIFRREMTRRSFTRSAPAPFAALTLGLPGSNAYAAAGQPVRGRTMTMTVDPEPAILCSALNSSSPIYTISPKMFDGLVTYARDLSVLPCLATAWNIAPDGLSISFTLRPGVTWHDGKPFTSADVQYTMMEILKKHHARGISTFVNLTGVDTPDDHTAIFRLSAPSPYILHALAGAESPILPKHVYAGSDPLMNPANTAPIGTGPFKFGEWQRGSYVLLNRNEHYWDAGKPYLDQLIVRFIGDSSARSAALESGEVQYGAQYVVPLNDVARLRQNPSLQVSTDGFEYNTSVNYFEFNLRRPMWQDVRVRRAIAHAIDKKFVADVIWRGFAIPADGPITNKEADFHTSNVPTYPFDLAAAAALLDEAGYPKKENGIRFKTTIDYSPSGDTYAQTAEILKQNLAKIGVDATIRASDSPSYIRRIWTQYDFDLNLYSLSNIADPVIGIQRLYWSKAIQKGVPYSNGSGYRSADADRLLEAAQVENDPKKRQQLYWDFQKLEMTDLPNMAVVYIQWFSIYNKAVMGLNRNALGPYDSFADVYLQS